MNTFTRQDGSEFRTHVRRGPECKIIMKMGLGTNSWALAALFKKLGIRPKAIVCADPGFEWDESWIWAARIGAPWLEQNGFPPITIVSRASEAKYRPRAEKTESLLEECERINYPPSAAFGLKKCSMVYKAEPSFWWIQRQSWARFEYGMRRRINVAIGYDYGERRRWFGKDEFTSNSLESEWCYPTYPLVDARLDRDGCEDLCREEFGAFVSDFYGYDSQTFCGGPVPPKSACKFCPNNSLADWYRLAERHPLDYERIVELSRRCEANVESDAVGFLWRAMPAGNRRLHIWHDNAYEGVPPPPVPGLPPPVNVSDDDPEEMPCECSL